MTRQIALSFSILLLLSACGTVTELKPTPDRQVHQATSDELAQLLEKAESAFSNNRLTTPSSDNAYDYYLTILKRDPDNTEAKLGINSIVEQYLAWAMDHIEKRNFARARQYVAKAESIDKGHPNIRPVIKRINDTEDRKTLVFRLAADAVKRQNSSAIDFWTIAKALQPGQSFVTIKAPTDAAGRWIYQQLASRVDFRIPAEFVKSSNPSISVAQ